MQIGRGLLSSIPSKWRTNAGTLFAGIIIFALTIDACPTAESDAHLTAPGYSITASDLLVATAKGSDHAPTVTVGRVELGSFQFASPETTGTTVASALLKASIRCATVPNNGCTGASSPGTNGNSTCLGCAGTVSHAVSPVSGGGAWLSSGGATDSSSWWSSIRSQCSCSSTGTVTTPATIWNATATTASFFTDTLNTIDGYYTATNGTTSFYTAANNGTTDAACDTCSCAADGTPSGPAACSCSCNRTTCSATDCACSAAGGASGTSGCGCTCPRTNCTNACTCSAEGVVSGDSNCGCRCNREYCSPNPQPVPIENTTAGQNCTCSSSGIASGPTRCGCTCTSTTFSCSCARDTCNMVISADGKTSTSTGGISTWGGGTCTVTALCSGGFHDGDIYTGYNTTSKVFPELFDSSGSLGTDTFLNGTTPTYLSGVFTFGSLTVSNLARLLPSLTLKINAGTSGAKVLSSNDTSPFAVWPKNFRVVQTAALTIINKFIGAAYYAVNAQGFADLGNYTLQLLDSAGSVISGQVSSGFNASISLITSDISDHTCGYWFQCAAEGGTCTCPNGRARYGRPNTYLYVNVNSTVSCTTAVFGVHPWTSTKACDCFKSVSYPTQYADLTLDAVYKDDLVVLNRDGNVVIPDKVLLLGPQYQHSFGLQVVNLVGSCFGIVFQMPSITDAVKYLVMSNGNDINGAAINSNYFRIVPGMIKVARGPDKALFDAPRVVKVDGSWNESTGLKSDGLPNPLHVLFQDASGRTLTHGTCTACVMARLVLCSDAKQSSVSKTSTSYPTCTDVSQAACAAENTATNKCTSSTKNLDTLTGTTLVNMINGTATFTNLQLSFVVGSGYKLQFTHYADGKSTTGTPVTTTGNAAHYQVLFPSNQDCTARGWGDVSCITDSARHNSFFVRPYALSLGTVYVSKFSAGRGMDNDGDGIGDGVGQGETFGSDYQPLVYLKGNGYDFFYDYSFNDWGWTPIFAEIKSCGGGSCSNRNITLKSKGGTTPPSWDYKAFDANTMQRVLPTSPTMQDITHAKRISCCAFQNRIGMWWNDLAVFTNDSITWQNDVVLTFKVGPGGNDTFTSIDSKPFDVYIAPDPPRNLRVHSYGDLGFRVEFEPAPVLRAQPLSGFLIQVDVCAQSTTRCIKKGTAGSKTCLDSRALNTTSGCFKADHGLGQQLRVDFGLETNLDSDLTTGGGYTEDVLLNYTGSTPNENSAIEFYIKPKRLLREGDKLVLDLGRSIKFVPLTDFSSCSLEGPDASSFTVEKSDSQTLVLNVAAGKTLVSTRPLRFSAPITCQIKLPPFADTDSKYGFIRHAPPLLIHAPVLGEAFSARGDNCKGTAASTTGCVATTTYTLPIITDVSTLDGWQGAPRFGGIDDDCRAGRSTGRMCTLSIGQDWTMGAKITLDWSNNFTSIAYPLIAIEFTRERALSIGDWIDIPIPGMRMQQPSGGVASCQYFVENIAFAPDHRSCIGQVHCRNMSQCFAFSTEVRKLPDNTWLDVQGWQTIFDVTNSVLSIYVGSPVLADVPMNITVRGFNADSSSRTFVSNALVDARVRRGNRTTVIFRNGADTITYSGPSPPTGNEVVQSGGLTIGNTGLYNFRVYAYNQGFRSTPKETLVQNRPIQVPQAPAYFTQIKQDVIGLEMRFTRLPSVYVDSSPREQEASPQASLLGANTRLGISFTPERDIEAGNVLTIPLPKFESDIGYLPFSNNAATVMFQDLYKVDGLVTFSLNTSVNSSLTAQQTLHGCRCTADGGILTPRTKYMVTRVATGSAAQNFTAASWEEEIITGEKTANESARVTALYAGEVQRITLEQCGDCSCSLEGVPTKPSSSYSTTGNCTICSCSADGIASYAAQYAAAPINVTNPADCSNCTCGSTGVISLYADANGIGDCSLCNCMQQPCTCGCQLVRKCECGCREFERYKCKCNQNRASDLFASALWSKSESSLLLTTRNRLDKDTRQVVWIGENVGIKMPTSAVDFDSNWRIPPATAWGFNTEAQLGAFKLNWVSALPSILRPRLGFVVQFTTDVFWRSNVQTVYYPDDLSQGIPTKFAQQFSTLAAAVTDTDKTVPITNDATWLRRGQYILIDSEIMRVVQANSTNVDVFRGQFETPRAAHLAAANISLVQIGTTDVSIESGYDTRVASDAFPCRVGNPLYYDEGCNPSRFVFPSGVRLFSSATVAIGAVPQANFAAACSGNATSCSADCTCEQTQAVLGADIGNPRPRGTVELVSPGDPLSYPKVFSGRVLKLGPNYDDTIGLGSTPVPLDSETKLLSGKYIRIDDEIMFVMRVGDTMKSVIELNLFQASGGSQCTCSIYGTVSCRGVGCSTSGCMCTGSQGTNCTAGGTLDSIGGGGGGFKGAFSVSNGKIVDLWVTNTGENYTTNPKIVISSGGSTNAVFPCRATFYPTISPQFMVVARAQLGTVAAIHKAQSPVFFLPWSSQSLPSQPTKSYSFRIAAYNQAGFSPFLYYKFNLLGKNPKVLMPAGNEVLEITMSGGALVGGNVTVYLVPPGTSYQDAPSKGKLCVSPIILDKAGTRISCRYPSWVGAKFDLMVTYKSGMVSQVAVGAGWIEYAAPILTGVVPALVDTVEPGIATTITVSGSNFGLNSDDVTGVFAGPSFEAPLPCAPLIVLNDKKILCTLTTKSKQQQLVGDIIITAGNATNHGGGQSTQTVPATSGIILKPQPVQVETKIQANFAEVTATPAKLEAFKTTFVTDLVGALGVPKNRIEILDIKSGSVIVIFNILPDTSSSTSVSPAALAVNLAQQAANPDSALRKGSLTGSIQVSLPAGTEALAAAASTTASSTTVPQYFSKCVPRSYTKHHMGICYDCCHVKCQTGSEVPKEGGSSVSPGQRAATCSRICLIYCGYDRAKSKQEL